MLLSQSGGGKNKVSPKIENLKQPNLPPYNSFIREMDNDESNTENEFN